MTEELSPAGLLYAAIKSLDGWYYLLENSEDRYERSRSGRTAGQIVSSILLAAGEESTPLAVAGSLGESQSGRLVIVYSDCIVVVDAKTLATDSASYSTQVRFLDEASDLSIETRHSYYDGVDTYPRTRGFAFEFTLDGGRVRLEAKKWAALRSPLVEDQAVYAAYVAIRSRKAAR